MHRDDGQIFSDAYYKAVALIEALDAAKKHAKEFVREMERATNFEPDLVRALRRRTTDIADFMRDIEKCERELTRQPSD